MELSPADLAEIVGAFEASYWQELSLSVGDMRLELSKTGRPLGSSFQPSPAPAEPASRSAAMVVPSAESAAVNLGVALASSSATAAPTAGGLDGLVAITTPSVGVFWRSPQPGAPPFVSVGDMVTEADTVCIVEVMKLMSHIPALVAGTVRSVEVENGHMVEQGQVLLLVETTS